MNQNNKSLYKVFIFFVFISFFFTLIFLSPGVKAQDKTLIKSIEYDVPIFNELSYDFTTGISKCDWWDRNIENSRLFPFQQSLITKALDGIIKVFDDKGNLLNSKEICHILSQPDTIHYLRTSPPFDEYDTILNRSIFPGDIKYLRFREQWTYDSITFKINKQITGYSPLKVEYDPLNNKAGKIKSLFWIKCNTDSNVDYQPLAELIRYMVPLFTNVKLVDSLQLINISDDTLTRFQFLNSFINSVEKGQLNIYDNYEIESFYNYYTDKITVLSKEKSQAKIVKTDTYNIVRPDPPYDEYDSVIINRLNINNIGGFEFYEKWLINAKTLEIKKEVLGFETIIENFDYTDLYVTIPRDEKLFYFSFEKPLRSFELK